MTQPIPADWTSTRKRTVSLPEHVVFRRLVEETVLLNIETGRYHGIDAIGDRFFTVMREAPDLETAAAQLAEEYDQPVERISGDLLAFCSQLAALGLITLH